MYVPDSDSLPGLSHVERLDGEQVIGAIPILCWQMQAIIDGKPFLGIRVIISAIAITQLAIWRKWRKHQVAGYFPY